MIITLEEFTEDYRIKADSSQYMVQHLVNNNKTGVPEWYSFKYYTKLPGALEFVARQVTLGKAEKVSLEIYIKMYREGIDELSKMCRDL